MAKIVLDNVVGGYNLAKINENFQKIEDAFNDEVLYRDNPVGEVNTVKQDVDMDGNSVINIGDLHVGGTFTVEGINFDGVNSAFVWRGPWSNLTAYAVSDAVQYGGSSYICITAHTGSAPPSVNWDLLAAEGASLVSSTDITDSTGVGRDLITAVDAAAGRTTLGSGVTGDALFAAATAAAARSILSAAASGANSDITSLTVLTSIPNGTVNNLPTVTGAFKNLAASATGSSANVTVTADEIVLSNASNQYATLRSVSLTIAGTSVGANALDAGTIATGTWYSVWVIWNGTTTAGLLSTSATAPTLPGGYTHKARVGWIKTDGTGNKYPLAFKQYGRKVRYVVNGNVTGIPLIQGGGAAGSTATPTYVSAQVQSNSATSGIIPSTAFIASLNLSERGGSSQSICAPSASYGAYSSTSNPPPMIGGVASVATSVTSVNYDMILESINVYFALGSVSSYLYLTGWEDNI
jgi:hypothetical protein